MCWTYLAIVLLAVVAVGYVAGFDGGMLVCGCRCCAGVGGSRFGGNGLRVLGLVAVCWEWSWVVPVRVRATAL